MKMRRIIGVKKNEKKIMKRVNKILQTFAPSKSRENIKKDWRKKRRKKLVEKTKEKCNGILGFKF